MSLGNIATLFYQAALQCRCREEAHLMPLNTRPEYPNYPFNVCIYQESIVARHKCLTRYSLRTILEVVG